jgi:branched-chain amino acid transport system substrate-binding protein
VNLAGGVLGRPLEIVVEDTQSTNPGAVMAFSRLSGRSEIAAFIGLPASTSIHAFAPDLLKAAKPMMFGGTDPVLTHMGNRWLFRCRPNDIYSARVIARFGIEELKKKRWAILYSTEAFGTSGMKGLVETLAGIDVTPVLVQGYVVRMLDFTPVVLAIKQSGADILAAYFWNPSEVAAFARQFRQLGLNIPIIGSPSTVATTAVNLGGPALYGTYGASDYSPDANPEALAYASRYEKRFNLRADYYSAWSFDAVNLLAQAINAAGTVEPEAVRAALLNIKGFRGVEGEYNFDANGDGLRGYNIVRNEKGALTFERRFEFED